MSRTEIILLILAFIAAGFSLYKKYIKKDQGTSVTGQRKGSGSSLSSHSADDDYEPYSKK